MSRIVLHDKAKLEMINPENRALLQRYKMDMSMRNLSEKTQEHYTLDLNQWFIYILDNQGNKAATEITDDEITEFLYFCKTGGNNSERIRVRIATISAFYKFLRKRRIIKENPTEFIDRPKIGHRIIRQTYLNREQIALMREKLIEYGNPELRLYATLSLSTMARVSAIASIRWDQIDMESKSIRGVLEKEAKIVDLYFSDECKYLLQELKAEREEKGIDDYGFVFKGRKRGTHITSTTLNGWCHKIGRMIGIESLHPHDYRHSGATLLKNSGMALEDVSILLNHESTDTTKRFYIKADTAKITERKQAYSI